MSKCPYTWVRGLFGVRKKGTSSIASELRVRVSKNGEIAVDVSLPAKSARWLMELIPSDVMKKIHEEGIPIERMQDELASKSQLTPETIFSLNETHRTVDVWLE